MPDVNAYVNQYIFGGIFTIGGAAAIYYGFNRLHKFQIINDTPTSKIRSMAMGIVEINGIALAEKYLLAPFSQSECVYYRYVIKEYRMHTSTDSKGRTRVYYSWDVIATGEKKALFFTQDETGKVIVDPEGAEINIQSKKIFLQRRGFGAISAILSLINKNKSIDFIKNGLIQIDEKKFNITFSSVGDRMYYEYFIEPNEKIYVLGTATNEKQKVLIKKGENEETFIISNKSEKDLLSSLRTQLLLCFILGGIAFIIGVGIFLFSFGLFNF